MCGIVGMLDLRDGGRIDPALVRAMSTAIRHRGPDGDGFYDEARHSLSLGMRRLSIIDVAGSDQPLYNEDHSKALVFNGEIYNYRELRPALIALGHQPRTDGDGELLIHLYEQYGLQMFQHLRGMYAFALWDNSARRLILAVDHIGMKPLYLYEQDGLLCFASEIKAFLGLPHFSPRLNLELVDSYLSFGFPIGQETLFEGVRRLMPAHVLVADLATGQVSIQRHWAYDTPPRQPDTHTPEAQIIEQTRQRLRESVSLHLRSDVPLGLFLSGGVDSATLLALMAEQDSQIKTYTIGFHAEQPDHELAQARRIAEHFHAEHHERVITAQEWWTGLERYAYAHDEPNANPSAVSMLLLSEMTAQHVKVVLTGLGGDELFGGYPHHRSIPALLQHQSAWGHLLRPFKPAFQWAEARYGAMKRYRYLGAIPTYLPRLYHASFERPEALRRAMSFDGMAFSDSLRTRLYTPELAQGHSTTARLYADIVARAWRPDPRATAQALVIETWLMGNALLSQDKVSMAHSLEARVPFFDPALLNYAPTLPHESRLRANKYLLREALRPLLPTWALERPKHPFSTPIRAWFARDLRSQIQSALYERGSLVQNLFNQQGVANLLEAHFSGREKQEEVVLRLLNLNLWGRAFGVN